MKTFARLAATVVVLYFWASAVLGGLERPGVSTGWWLLSATAGAAVLLLATWWPHRKDRP